MKMAKIPMLRTKEKLIAVEIRFKLLIMVLLYWIMSAKRPTPLEITAKKKKTNESLKLNSFFFITFIKN